MADQVNALFEIMQKHEEQDFEQYYREHRYRAWMGTSPNNIIVRSNELDDHGEKVRFHFSDDLPVDNKGEGVLKGGESTYGVDHYDATPIWYREAITTTIAEDQRNLFNLASRHRRKLRTWMKNMEHKYILDAFEAMHVDDANVRRAKVGTDLPRGRQKTYLDCSLAERNAWLTANEDRAIFGNSAGNTVTGDIAASLANLDNTEALTLAGLYELKEFAEVDAWETGGSRPIEPVDSADGTGRCFFKMEVGPKTWKAFTSSEEVRQLHRDALTRGEADHPLFQGGDFIVNGIMLRKNPRIRTIAGAGAAGADVEPAYLFGRFALGMSDPKTMKYTRNKDDDYGFNTGIGVQALQGFDKMFYEGGARAGKQVNMINAFYGVAA